MSRSAICSKIGEARLSHANWIRRARHLIDGLPVGEEFIPLDSTECHFGQWFYDEVMKFKSVPLFYGTLSEIEEQHSRLHNIYMHIYKIYFVDTKPSWIRSLITRQRKSVSAKMREKAQRHFVELQLVSEELLSALDVFEAKVKSTTSEVFAELAV